MGLAAFGCKKNDASTPPDETADAESGADDDENGELEPLEEDPYLNPSNFITVVEEHQGEIDTCYAETAAKESEPPTGRVKTTVVIDRDGVVKEVTFDDQRSDLKHDGLYACIVETVKAWQFPTSIGELDQPMPYTFKF